MAKLSDKLVRIPEDVDRKVTRVQKKLKLKSKYKAIEIMADLYLLEGGE